MLDKPELESILTDTEMQKYCNVAKHYLRAIQLNDKDYINKTEELLASNLTEANSILTELSYEGDYQYGYYGDDYPSLLSEAIALTIKIAETSPNEEIKTLAGKVADLLRDLAKRLEIDYEKYSYKYEYPYYYYGYPYYGKSRAEKYRMIEQEEVQKYLQELDQKETEEIRREIRENLVGDIILKDLSRYAFNEEDRPITTAEQRIEAEKWRNLDYRLAKAIAEIKQELEAKERYQQQLEELKKEEAELSKDEAEWQRYKAKLLDKAVELIIKGGL